MTGSYSRLIKINDGTRDVAAFSYDASGRVSKIQNADDLSAASGSPDPNLSPNYNSTHSLEIAYDASGRVSSVSDGPITNQTPSTSTWTFGYFPGATSATPTRAAHGSLPAGTGRTADGYTTVTPPRQQGQPNPKSVKTYYDSLDHPIEVDDILDHVTEVAYNTNDQLMWTEDADGNPTDTSWDAVDNVLLSTTGPDPDGAGPLGRPTTSYRYDEKATGSSGTAGPPMQGLQASYYDNPQLKGDPLVRQTDARVDFSWGAGAPAGLTGTDNYGARWSGDLIASSDGDYLFTTVADNGTRLVIDNLNAISNWTSGSVRSVSSQPIHLTAGKHTLVLEYEQLIGNAEIHLRWSCATCSPSLSDNLIPSSALRPAWNNQTSVVAPSGRLSFHHFSNPALSRADYDLQKLGDGSNVITGYSFDSFGRTTQKVMPKGNAARTIDANGDLQGAIDTAYATSWSYYLVGTTVAPPAVCGGGALDQAGLPKTVSPHGIATTTSVYDAAGRPLALTNGRGTTCTSYDAEGRVTSAKAPDDLQATTYTYDPNGAQRSASDASGTVINQYDEAGRVVRTVDSFSAEATLSYDADGNTTQRAATPTPGGTSYTTTYNYNDAGQLTSLTDPASRSYSFGYDARGNLRWTQYPNATFSWNDYDAAGWLTALYNRHGTLGGTETSAPADSQASPLADYTYSYDIDGRKTQEVRSGGGLTTETTGYGYDTLGRLASVTLPDGTQRTYTFDLDSNRTAIVENNLTVDSYTYDPSSTAGVDQLTNVSQPGQTTTYAYTADGQVKTRGADTLTWDGWGRLSGGTFNGTIISYGFDATGFRRQRTGNGTTTRYLLGGSFEANTSGTITLADVDGPQADLAHYTGPPTTGSTVSYSYYNGHGDVAAETDNTGTRTNAFTYDSFGAPKQSTPTNSAIERWIGRWDKKLDTTSGLIEMGARPYDPGGGRFFAVDPVQGGSFNNYDYAGQDPINNYDLSGTVCGPGGVGDRLVPDRVPGLFDFRQACGAHDKCYGTWGTSRLRCDIVFYANATTSCRRQHRGFFGVSPLRDACDSVATAYTNTIRTLGAPVFVKDQVAECRRRRYHSFAVCVASAVSRSG